ncbi:Outer membrane efflux protein [Brevundimonas sp. Bb-A]|jgi:cobalt-zinc-cadmium efflux system outer membrane protein|nr:Outer membrane efflux protein [Brevundimonas sp. Bb-A]
MRVSLVWPLIMVSLAGCATYAPSPLPMAPSADPTSASLADRLRLARPEAQPIDLTAPLGPDALAAIAIVLNLDLRSQRARVGVAEAQAFDAGLFPDPQFSASLDRPQSAPMLVDALAASLGLDTSAFYLRPQRLRSARAVERQARLDLAWLEWQTGNQAAVLAARIQGLENNLQLTREAEALSASILNRSLAALARGDLSATDVEPRRIAEADAADRLRVAERDLASARLELNALLGLSPATSIQLTRLQPPSPCLLHVDTLVDRALAQRLDLQALRAGYEGQEATLQVAVLQQYPRLNLSLNGARDTGAVRTNGVAVGFDLPLWNRNRGQIAIQTATREQLRSEYETRLFRTQADIATLVSALDIGRRQQADLANQLGPLRASVAAFENAAARGDIARITAETARLSLLDKSIALSALDQAMAEQTRALQTAVGTSLETFACAV